MTLCRTWLRLAWRFFQDPVPGQTSRTPPIYLGVPHQSDKSGVPSEVTFGSLVRSSITMFRVEGG